ncbi:aspartate kinase [Sporosarcina ureilytica]|uniref:aspartate kinase n=1 Tax=Sporosarcina ureilytica TaxID=298596 RepID=A0A1D8JI28_9BACL|nr:aspartate kinase [Sporosarcina ureilytica]AOV08371.1 aspartate kinase [Sporosarcina ureilytica]
MIVQKFGGIAMQNEEMRNFCMNHIQDGIKQYKKIAVVVSAIGRLGDPYATDSLINLSEAFASDYVARDLVASCGELIASAVLSAELHQFGVSNTVLHGKQTGILTTGNFGDASIDSIDTSIILKSFEQVDCVIIPGFQGMDKSGHVMTLGRGGSDLTAVALADSLNASHVEFFKDVPGVLTGDPDFVSDYDKYDFLSFDEFLNLLNGENTIIQKRAAVLAKEKAIPLYVRGIASTETGTWIAT